MAISSTLFLAKIRRTDLQLPATQLLVSRFDWNHLSVCWRHVTRAPVVIPGLMGVTCR